MKQAVKKACIYGTINVTNVQKLNAFVLTHLLNRCEASRDGIFASGDVVNGARTVVDAVAHSKIVAETMHKYIQGLNNSI